MEPSIKDTSSASYEKWVSDLRVKDVGCCHDSKGALMWLTSFRDVDVIRIQEYIQGKFNEHTGVYKFKIRRCADLLYGFYSPVPITSLAIGFSAWTDRMKVNIDLPKPNNGFYLFKIPLPVCGMKLGQVCFEYTLSDRMRFEMPVTLISGWLSQQKREEVAHLPEQNIEFASIGGFRLFGSQNDVVLLECIKDELFEISKERHWILRRNNQKTQEVLKAPHEIISSWGY